MDGLNLAQGPGMVDGTPRSADQMVVPFNLDRFNELVAEEGRLRKEVDEVSKRIVGEFNQTDKPADPQRDLEHSRLVLNHTHLTRQHAMVAGERDRMARSRPVDKRSDAYNTPYSRWMRKGAKELSAEERQAHVVEGPIGSQAMSLPQILGATEDDDGRPTAEDLKGVVLPPNASNVEWFFEPTPAAIRPDEIMNTVVSDESPGGQDWTPVPLYPSLTQGMTLKLIAGVLGRTSEWRTRHGLKTKFGTLDDTDQEGEWFQNQKSQATEQDYTPDGVEMGTQIHSSKGIVISLAMIQDSPYNVEAVARELQARRHYRAIDKAMVIGDGANDTPRGIVTDSVRALQSSSKANFVGDELIELAGKPDVAYLMGEGSPAGAMPVGGRYHTGYVFHQNTLTMLRQLKDGDMRYLWQPGYGGLVMGNPPMFNGFPYVIDNNMAEIAANAITVLFGPLALYMKRMAGPRISARFFDSGTADGFGVKFVSFVRCGGRIVGGFEDVTQAAPKCEAIQHIQSAA